MRLVHDEHESFSGVGLEPGSCLIEHRPLQRTHQHVLEHRVVGDEEVRRISQNLVSCEEFRILREQRCSIRLAIAVGPSLATRSIPSADVTLGGPLSPPLQFTNQSLSFSGCVGVGICGTIEQVDVELLDRSESPLVPVSASHAWIQRPACVPREACRPSAAGLEELPNPCITKHKTKAP